MRVALTTLSLVVSLVVGGQLESEASAKGNLAPGDVDTQTAIGGEAEDFEAARESPILSDVFTTCEFTLEGAVDLSKACDGTVLLDSIELECNSDWSLSSPTMLRFKGSSCEQLTNGQPHRVQASWPCEADSPASPRR